MKEGNYPLVTVQIPTYNQQQYISRTIESVLMQDYPNLEIVIADDGSTDDTGKIAKNYTDPRIRYFRNEPNIGRVANYRRSLYQYASGEWVVNLDGDDYFTDPFFISRAMRLIMHYREQQHTIAFYQSTIVTLNQNTGERSISPHRLLGKHKEGLFDTYFDRFFRNNYNSFAHLATIYNRPLAMKTGFYEHNILSTDSESMLKLSLHGKVILDNAVTGVWRKHGHNASADVLYDTEGEKILDRLADYAESIRGREYAIQWRTQRRKDSQRFFLELLAEKGETKKLVRDILKYNCWNLRTPVLVVKSVVKGFRSK